MLRMERTPEHNNHGSRGHHPAFSAPMHNFGFDAHAGSRHITGSRMQTVLELHDKYEQRAETWRKRNYRKIEGILAEYHSSVVKNSDQAQERKHLEAFAEALVKAYGIGHADGAAVHMPG